MLEWNRSKCSNFPVPFISDTLHEYYEWSLLLLALQYKGNVWEGRYRHCLQAFQSFLSKLFKRRQDADCG